MRFRREHRLEEQFRVVRNEKVRGSNPLSSTQKTGSDLRKRGQSHLLAVLLEFPLRTPAT